VLEKRPLKRMFGPKKDQAISWRNLHEKLHNLHPTLSVITEDEMGLACSANGVE
jgi:hypothetical protein